MSIDTILEKLYNSAWVEGNTYDDRLEQLGLDTSVRSPKEIRRCETAKSELIKLIEEGIIGADENERTEYDNPHDQATENDRNALRATQRESLRKLL